MADQPAYEIDDDKTYRATIVTDRGTMVLDLDPKLAPKTHDIPADLRTAV